MSQETAVVVVLADGAMWSQLEGCAIYVVPKSQLLEVQDANDFTPSTIINLSEIVINEKR